jgi:DNA-binding transcriptional MocR family regulator
MQLNPHLIDTGTPPIPEAQAWLAAWQGPAADRIDLSQAVPGYPPHETMLQALSTAAGTRAAASYGSIYGDTALRDAYGAHLSQVYGAPVKPRETMITSGCNQAFIIAVMALAVLPALNYLATEGKIQRRSAGSDFIFYLHEPAGGFDAWQAAERRRG